MSNRFVPCCSLQVPLTLSLHYESTLPVADQSILKVHDVTSSTVIKGGHAKLNVRIEEVSRNHRQQCFVVKVGPNVKECPLDQDVGPAFSPRVAVFSKHTKKPRPEETQASPSSSVAHQSSSFPSSATSAYSSSSSSTFAHSSPSVCEQSTFPATPSHQGSVVLVPMPQPPSLRTGPSGDPQTGEASKIV